MENHDEWEDDFPEENLKMKQLHFRPLRADEVEVRPVEVKTGENPRVSLLLYQDARSAMNILDQTVGPKGWQKEYYEAAGLLFCKIGIFDSESQQWLWKANTGSRSNIEEDKGLASDSFKRAAVDWGIGRELYSAPRMTVDLTEKDFFNNKLCQNFRVAKMVVTDGAIKELVIVDKFGKTRLEYPKTSGKNEQTNRPVQSARTCPPAPAPWNSEADLDPLDEELVYVDKTFQEPSPTEMVRNFCSRLKQEPGVNQEELNKFYKWLNSPDKENPEITRAEGLAKKYKVFKPEELWKGWLKNVRG